MTGLIRSRVERSKYDRDQARNICLAVSTLLRSPPDIILVRESEFEEPDDALPRHEGYALDREVEAGQLGATRENLGQPWIPRSGVWGTPAVAADSTATEFEDG